MHRGVGGDALGGLEVDLAGSHHVTQHTAVELSSTWQYLRLKTSAASCIFDTVVVVVVAPRLIGAWTG